MIVRPQILEERMHLVEDLLKVTIPKEYLTTATINSGVNIKVCSTKPFMVSAFWIVKIDELHIDLQNYPWIQLRDALWDNKFLSDNDKARYISQPVIHLCKGSNEESEINVKPPVEIDISKYDKLPRSFYPLVIIVSLHEKDFNPTKSEAVASIFLLHFKDTIVPTSSHVIKQYTKIADGRVLDVSKLFIEDERSCMICYESPNVEPLYCLLPCRHSSICHECIRRLTECPKCRHPIRSVFDLNAPLASSQQAPGVAVASPGPGFGIDPSVRHLYDDAREEEANRRQQATSSNPGHRLLGYFKSFWEGSTASKHR